MIKEFYKPETVEEALELRGRLGRGAWFLGGGTELNSINPPAGELEYFISLDRLSLGAIERTRDELLMGASATLQALIEAPEVFEVIKQACRHMSNRSIRNQATLGGHLAARHPYASVLPILIALDAKVDLVGSSGPMTVPIAQYLASDGRELITSIRLPLAHPEPRAAVREHSRSANDLAMLTVAVACRLENGLLRDPAIVVGGITPLPTRLGAVERRLDGQPLPARDDLQQAVAKEVVAEDGPRGSAEFKRYLAGTLVADALAEICMSEQEVAS